MANAIESFRVRLTGFDALQQAENPLETLEKQLLEAFAEPVSLLRWAVVSVEAESADHGFWCEGAAWQR